MRTRTLHPAERKYLLAAANGFTSAEIARFYLVSTNTVTTSLKNAKAALGARNITHAAALALKYGEFSSNTIEPRKD